ncbi:hypothetical protein XELAEV_18038387mg [Xenopus laevis]|uniref:Uncharacterized protein n=1 Tax=Xenopus laevis TaxID=8355 RepID=A0A974C5Y5_XENLA|nr:hypothetical protein XELAEV_18038387mg [Xenopus laevis]
MAAPVAVISAGWMYQDGGGSKAVGGTKANQCGVGITERPPSSDPGDSITTDTGLMRAPSTFYATTGLQCWQWDYI